MMEYLMCEIENLLRKGYNRFYIYPFGRIGMMVKDILEERYGCTDIILVDNHLCRFNKNIIAAQDLHGKEWKREGGEILVIASNNPELYRNIRLEIKRQVPEENIKDLFPIPTFMKDKDYQRISSLAAVSREIYERNISGNVAEGGVYRGDFAQYINMLFPDRKLYLFDSFEGFDSGSVVDGCDNRAQTDQWIHMLKDTSVDTVMKKMLFPENVIVKKGYLPGSAENVTDQFCFVNLDIDLYAPVYESLHYFWENLSNGGCIFVHDYYVWDGVGVAVRKFCREKKVGFVCLPDACSVAIAKSL